MHYLTRFTETKSDRLKAIVEMHWATIRDWIHLIASACYPFPEVMKALAEPMCVFPIEGLPGDRYFPGTSVMDAIEVEAEELLRQLFSIGDEYCATVQPHSGTQANQIVFNAVLKAEDRVLSLSPTDGGHISHKVIIGRRNPVVFYPLTRDNLIDYEELERVARKEQPSLVIAGGSSYPREIDFRRIGDIAHSCGALFHADVSHTATFIAAGLHASVFPVADFVTFNMVKNMRGPNGGVLIYRSRYKTSISGSLFPVTQGGPNENTMFAKLVGLDSLIKSDFTTYAARMIELARLFCSVFVESGYDVITDGTDSHQILINLTGNELTGRQVEEKCEMHRVLVNRNLISNDPQKPRVTSGVRLGTSCLAILGYTNSDAERLAQWLVRSFAAPYSKKDSELIQELTQRYNVQLLPRAGDSI